MSCDPGPAMNELEFFRHLHLRGGRQCGGQLIALSWFTWQVHQLERTIQDQCFSDLLWSGFVSDQYIGVQFSLCAAHWFDLVWYIGLLAHQRDNREWALRSGALLSDLCFAASWDQKEVANHVTSLGARLT